MAAAETRPVPVVLSPRSRTYGAHRFSSPTASIRSRAVVAAVAVGAVTVAGHGLASGIDDPEATEAGEIPLAVAGNQATLAAYNGVGGDAPAPGVLPLDQIEQLPLAQLPLPAEADQIVDDVLSLAKGQRLGAERAEAERRAAERIALEAAQNALRQAELAGLDQLPVAVGSYVRPAIGRFTSGFGARWGTTHYGVDIANAIGTPIYAVTDGIVVESGPASGFGMWVKILHPDGLTSIYGHISKSLVAEGERVNAGQKIALMGNRGQSTGPHLHFEIWDANGAKLNPQPWLANKGIMLGTRAD